MRTYSYVTALAVVFVLLLSATAFANGVVMEEVIIVPAPEVQPAPPVGAGTATPAPTTPTEQPAQRCYTMDQLVTLTVAETWELSGRNTDAWGDIIQAMADYSASTRGLDIPDTRQSGMWIGQLVRQQAQADPNRLLYSVVDNAVVQYAYTFGIRPMAG